MAAPETRGFGFQHKTSLTIADRNVTQAISPNASIAGENSTSVIIVNKEIVDSFGVIGLKTASDIGAVFCFSSLPSEDVDID